MREPKNTIHILHSERAQTNVLVLDANSQRAVEYESLSELDPYLKRLNIFFTSTLAEARDLAKSKRPKIAIFPERLGELDFVSIQAELKNAHEKLKLIPLVGNPTLAQYRESKKIGGILDFAQPEALLTYQSIRDLIVFSVRELVQNSSLEKDFKTLESLQTALLVHSPFSKNYKQTSAIILSQLLPHFDLTGDEIAQTILAEKLYLPTLNEEHYASVLINTEYTLLLDLLTQTATWNKEHSKPGSTMGLIITASNYLSMMLEQNQTIQAIHEKFQERPSFLHHLSVRVIDRALMTQVIDSIHSTEMRKSA